MKQIVMCLGERKKYENKKGEVRKLAAANKRELHATGGGTYFPKTDPCMDVILEITNPITINGMEEEFEGDSELFEFEQAEVPNIAVVENSSVVNNFLVTNRQNTSKQLNTASCASTSAANNLKIPEDQIPEVNVDENDLKSWKDHSPKDLKSTHNKKLLFTPGRRRPKAVQPIHTNFLSQQYSEVATLKAEYLKTSLDNIVKKEVREEEEFRLNKRCLELDIEIKLLQIEKLKNSFD